MGRAHPVAAIVKELAGEERIRALARPCRALSMLSEQSRQVQNTLSRLGQNVHQAAGQDAAPPPEPKPTQEHGG